MLLWQDRDPPVRVGRVKAIRVRYIMPVGSIRDQPEITGHPMRVRGLPVREFSLSLILTRGHQETVGHLEMARDPMARAVTVREARVIRVIGMARDLTETGRDLMGKEDRPAMEGHLAMARDPMDRVTAGAIREVRVIRVIGMARDLPVMEDRPETARGPMARVTAVVIREVRAIKEIEMARDLTEIDLPVRARVAVTTDLPVRARVAVITEPADSRVAVKEPVDTLPEADSTVDSRRMKMISQAMATVARAIRRGLQDVPASGRVLTSRFWIRRLRRRMLTAEAETDLIRKNY